MLTVFLILHYSKRGNLNVYIKNCLHLVDVSVIYCSSRLLDVGRKTDKADRQTLNLCADHLRRLNSLTYAAEMYKYVNCDL